MSSTSRRIGLAVVQPVLPLRTVILATHQPVLSARQIILATHQLALALRTVVLTVRRVILSARQLALTSRQLGLATVPPPSATIRATAKARKPALAVSTVKLGEMQEFGTITAHGERLSHGPVVRRLQW